MSNVLDAVEQEVTALIALDLSVAFDIVDHSILLDVLAKQYDVCSTALDWLDWLYTYLHPRSYCVKGNVFSSSRQLPRALALPNIRRDAV